MSIIAFDSHKHYTFARIESEDGNEVEESRIPHRRGNIVDFLSRRQKGSAVAVETIGNWYWIVDEIESAGMIPQLVHARKAKLMLGSINKTDKLDARGLNRLQRVGTLPTVWIPPGDLRDKRELPRTRMVLARQRTRLKNRIHSVLAKYGLQDMFEGISEVFGKAGRERLSISLKHLPLQTRYTTRILLRQLDKAQEDIDRIEHQMVQVYRPTKEIALLQTMPGVGPILSVVIMQEVGDVNRFGGPDRLASYAGTTPRVHASGDKVHYGRLRPDTNHYLKWAYSEAGNSVARNHKCYPYRHSSCLYKRIRARRGHAAAVGAVARHLAEATYWILRKGECYRERAFTEVSSKEA